MGKNFTDKQIIKEIERSNPPLTRNGNNILNYDFDFNNSVKNITAQECN